MRILYLVCTPITGNGGHYYSLRTTAEAISSEAEVFICDVGPHQSLVISASRVKTFYIPYTGGQLNKALSEINNLVEDLRINVIHAFDQYAFYFARRVANKRKIGLILTKAGGVNPGEWLLPYWPIAPELIVYSQENLAAFGRIRRYKYTKLHFLPNRISRLEEDRERISKLKLVLNPLLFTFLRICRLVPAYEKSVLQGIELVNRLNAAGNKVAQIIIIGVPVDDGVVERLSSQANENVILLTDKYYTAEAARLIPACNAYIGTGRGIMEAASFSKMLLAPVRDAAVPAIVDKKSFEILAKTNFSPRGYIPEFSEELEVEKIRRVIVNQQASLYEKFSEQCFTHHFDVAYVIEPHLNLYRSASPYYECSLADSLLNQILVRKVFRGLI